MYVTWYIKQNTSKVDYNAQLCWLFHVNKRDGLSLAESLRRWSTEDEFIIEESISGKSHIFILVFIWYKYAHT